MKQIYFERTQPGSSKPKEVIVQSSHTQENPFLEYAAKIEMLDQQIRVKQKEINLLEKNLKYMEMNLRKMRSIEYKVFTLKYIDGVSTKNIAMRVGYSEPQVYRILKIIKDIITSKEGVL